MNLFQKWLMCLIIAVFSATSLTAVEFELHGIIDTTFATGFWKTSEMLEANVRFKPHLDFFADDFHAVGSVALEYSALDPLKVNVKLGEVFAEYAWERFDFRLGRQIITWGKADGLQITDIICPRNYMNFIGVEYKDSRIPTNGIKVRHFGDFYTIEGIWTPVYIASFPKLDKNKPLSRVYFPEKIEMSGKEVSVEYNLKNKKPPHRIQDGEWGLKSSFFFSAIDFSFLFFRGWDHTPNYNTEVDTSPLMTGNPAKITLTPDHNRIWMVGMDMAIPAGMFIIRSEAAWLGKKAFAQKNATKPLSKHHQLKAMVGTECNPGQGWRIQLQYMEDVVFENTKKLNRSQRLPMLTFHLSKTFLRDTLKLSGGLLIGCDAWDTLTAINLSYDIIDNLKITLGGNLYCRGKKKGNFGKMERLSNIWLRGRFSF
ncbi:MAG: hypothetical protein CR988_05210 [Treponema sp.]|nr:MAG: hypothetical protein CR988_05210 [Treponema sp.]